MRSSKKEIFMAKLLITIVVCGSILVSAQNSYSEFQVQTIAIGERVHLQYGSNNITNPLEEEFPVAFYKFAIPQAQDEHELVVLLMGDRDFYHSPSLYVSATSEHPDGYVQDVILCGWLGVDVCALAVDNSNTEQQYYYLGVFCVEQCEFDLRVTYDAQRVLRVGDKQTFNFSLGADDNTFAIEVLQNDLLEYTTDLDYEILLEAFLLNPQSVRDGFQLYVCDGSDSLPSSENYDYNTYEIWNGGQAVRLDVYEDANITQFTALLVAANQSLVQITLTAVSTQRNISLGQTMYDIVEWGDRFTYVLHVPTSFDTTDYALSFDLEPFYGNPELYINVGSAPDTLTQYRWHDTQFDDKDDPYADRDGLASLTIAHDDIEPLLTQAGNRLIYITVYGQTDATFRLLVYTSDLMWRALTFIYVETGYIPVGELQQYQLDTYSLSESTDITVTATSLKGSVGVYVKKCCEVAWCELTNQDLHADTLAQLSNSGQLYYSTSTDTTLNSVTFSYDILEDSRCLFTVAVQNDGKSDGHYRLSAWRPGSIINLRESELLQGYLDEGEFDYYRFYIPSVQGNTAVNVTRVIMQISAVTGEIDVFISRTDPYPSEDDSDISGYWEVDSFVFDQGQLTGTYYIAVRGYSAAWYQIQATVYRAEAAQAKRLHFGIAQRGLLQPSQNDSYYFFPSDVSENDTNLFLYFHPYSVQTQERVWRQDCQPELFVTSTDGQPIEALSFYESAYFVYYSLPDIQEDASSRYNILLSHSQSGSKQLSQRCDDVYYRYQIIVNAEDVWSVVSDLGYIVEVDAGNTESFEVYLPTPARVYIELYQCFGSFDAHGASSYEKLEQQDYDIQDLRFTTSSQDQLLFLYEGEEAGSFYFNIQSEGQKGYVKSSSDGSAPLSALFMMITHVLPKDDEMPHEVFKVPELQPKQNSLYVITNPQALATALTISVPPLEIVQSRAKKASYTQVDVTYVLHITDQAEFLPFFAQCDLNVDDLEPFDLGTPNKPKHSKEFLTRTIDLSKITAGGDEAVQFNLSGLPPIANFQLMAILFIQVRNYSETQPFTFVYPSTSVNFTLLETQLTEKDELIQFKNKDLTNGNENESKQTFTQKWLWAIIWMVAGGAMTLGCLAYWCIRRRLNRLLPSQFEMSSGVKHSAAPEEEEDPEDKKRQQQEQREDEEEEERQRQQLEQGGKYVIE